MENPVVLVGQLMEPSFPLEIFRKKRNSLRRSPLFSFLPKWPKCHWTICLITLTYHAPWWDARFISQNCQWKEPFHLFPQRYNCFSHTYRSIRRKIPTGFSIQMESAPALTLFVFHIYQVPSEDVEGGNVQTDGLEVRDDKLWGWSRERRALECEFNT